MNSQADLKREETNIQVDVVSFPSDDLTLKGLLSRPDGAGPFPAVLFNHGAGRAYERVVPTLGPVFIERGYTFFMPYRRGHGLSSDQAPYFNDILKAAADRGGSEERGREMVRLLEGPYMTDQLAALKWYRQQPFVDAERIFVIGSSLGGILSVLVAAETSQIKASVSFAAAALSWSDSAPLRESMLGAASAAKVPVMFIQAENDADTTPSRALSATMAAAGKPHRLKLFPKFGQTTTDGHNFGYFGSQVWGRDLFDFLAKGKANDRYSKTEVA